MAKPATKALNVQIEEHTLGRFKSFCKAENKTMTEVLTGLMEEYSNKRIKQVMAIMNKNIKE